MLVSRFLIIWWWFLTLLLLVFRFNHHQFSIVWGKVIIDNDFLWIRLWTELVWTWTYFVKGIFVWVGVLKWEALWWIRYHFIKVRITIASFYLKHIMVLILRDIKMSRRWTFLMMVFTSWLKQYSHIDKLMILCASDCS